jgi:hypothetical protein
MRQREWNQQLREKWVCARLPRGNPRLLRRQRDESKGPGREPASRRAHARVASAAPSVKALRYAIPHEQRPLVREPWHAPTAGAARTKRAALTDGFAVAVFQL